MAHITADIKELFKDELQKIEASIQTSLDTLPWEVDDFVGAVDRAHLKNAIEHIRKALLEINQLHAGT